MNMQNEHAKVRSREVPKTPTACFYYVGAPNSTGEKPPSWPRQASCPGRLQLSTPFVQVSRDECFDICASVHDGFGPSQKSPVLGCLTPKTSSIPLLWGGGLEKRALGDGDPPTGTASSVSVDQAVGDEDYDLQM
jgi:hypothetical protein